MLSKKFFALLLALPIVVSAAPSENAGVYSTKEVPAMKPLLASLAPGATITEGKEGDLASFTCAWKDVTVKLTVDTHWNKAVEVPGIKGWIGRFPPQKKDTPAVAALARQLASTTYCIGCAITPGYDSDGKVTALLLGLAKALDGFVFTHESFYDVDGTKIVGFPDDPVSLKTRDVKVP
jgi:hypothetical protein